MTYPRGVPPTQTVVDDQVARRVHTPAPVDADLPRSRFAVSPADRLCLDLAALTIADQSLATTLTQVAELGRRMLPAVVGMSVALLDESHRCTFAGSGPLSAVLDERQYPEDLGPGIAAAALGQEVEVADTATDVVFRDFSRAASRNGVRWAVSMPVPGCRSVHASVTACGADEALPESHRALLADLAPHLTATLVNAYSYAAAVERAGQLHQAMASRATIEQAKGIVMSRRGCEAEEAFEILRQASMRSNRKLRDVAHAVVDGVVGGSAPHRPPAPDDSAGH